MNELEIPEFLKRKPKVKVMATEKKPRNKAMLPTILEGANGTVEISQIPDAEIFAFRDSWKKKLADVPRIELELRAINAAIRAKAK